MVVNQRKSDKETKLEKTNLQHAKNKNIKEKPFWKITENKYKNGLWIYFQPQKRAVFFVIKSLREFAGGFTFNTKIQKPKKQKTL